MVAPLFILSVGFPPAATAGEPVPEIVDALPIVAAAAAAADAAAEAAETAAMTFGGSLGGTCGGALTACGGRGQLVAERGIDEILDCEGCGQDAAERGICWAGPGRTSGGLERGLFSGG